MDQQPSKNNASTAGKEPRTTTGERAGVSPPVGKVASGNHQLARLRQVGRLPVPTGGLTAAARLLLAVLGCFSLPPRNCRAFPTE
jgi:hypothetical protein